MDEITKRGIKRKSSPNNQDDQNTLKKQDTAESKSEDISKFQRSIIKFLFNNGEGFTANQIFLVLQGMKLEINENFTEADVEEILQNNSKSGGPLIYLKRDHVYKFLSYFGSELPKIEIEDTSNNLLSYQVIMKAFTLSFKKGKSVKEINENLQAISLEFVKAQINHLKKLHYMVSTTKGFTITAIFCIETRSICNRCKGVFKPKKKDEEKTYRRQSSMSSVLQDMTRHLGENFEAACIDLQTFLKNPEDDETIIESQLKVIKKAFLDVLEFTTYNYIDFTVFLQQLRTYSDELLSFVLNMELSDEGNALHYSAYKNNISVVGKLNDTGCYNVDKSNKLGESVVSIISAYCFPANSEETQIIDKILSLGNVNFRTKAVQNTPLLLATQKKNYNVMKLLLTYRADVDTQNVFGTTPLMAAVTNNDFNVSQCFFTNWCSRFKFKGF